MPTNHDANSQETYGSTPEMTAAEISGFWLRLGAFIVDAFILAGAGYLLGCVAFDRLAQLGPWWGRILGFGIVLLYFGPLNNSAGKGQTIGKRLAGIRVQDRTGNTISPVRSLIRYSVLAVPFFLAFAIIPTSFMVSPVGFLMGPAIAGVGGAIIYLYVFNRRTRQSLHDLAAGTYVVRSSGPVTVGPVWKWHFLVVSFWILLVAFFIAIVTTKVTQESAFSKLLSVQETIQDQGKVHVVNVTVGQRKGPNGEATYFDAYAIWKQRPRDYEAALSEIASVILKEYPEVFNKNVLTVTVAYGYDIGIARSWETHTAEFPPQEWKKKIEAAGRLTHDGLV